MKIAIWIVQILLAVAFCVVGSDNLLTPIAELVGTEQQGAGEVPELVVRLIGLFQVTMAIGLILPALTRIRPQLAIVAAMGIVVMEAIAATTHITRGEFSSTVPIFILAALAAFVAYGRTYLAPIAPRSQAH